MLLKYIVSNFKSIGHPIEFSMIPTDDNTDERFINILHAKYGDIKVLRRGALFGPNASGKSAFVESMNFAQKYIIEPPKSGRRTGVNQYRGNIEELNETSLFQFVFYLDENIYEYGFALTPNQVSEEWLMIQSGKGFVPMFTRVTNNNGETAIDLEAKLASKNSKDRKLAEILKLSIKENQKNQLFLYKLKENGIKKAEKIVEWFENINIIFPESKILSLPMKVKADNKFREFLSVTLKNLDTGVSNITVVDDEINIQEFAKKINMPDNVIEELENKRSGSVIIDGRYYIFFENENKTFLIQMEFEHLLNNKSQKFNINDESDGTQRLLDLLPILFQIDNNIIYIVDEIDRSLHTKLSKYILNTFAKYSKNILSQIVFTAHDINLIDLRDFSKEEIWFIEKNNNGESSLKPFSDFQTTENQNVIKDYLNGRFGAVPVIRGDI